MEIFLDASVKLLKTLTACLWKPACIELPRELAVWIYQGHVHKPTVTVSKVDLIVFHSEYIQNVHKIYAFLISKLLEMMLYSVRHIKKAFKYTRACNHLYRLMKT